VSVVKINAITVPRERFAEFEKRFATRAGKVEGAMAWFHQALIRQPAVRESRSDTHARPAADADDPFR
jgi:heme-degrading monooxygenase HmoA